MFFFHLPVIVYLISVNDICAYVLLAGVRCGAVGAGLSHFDLQDGSFVVGAGQQNQVILKVKQSRNTVLLGL